MKKILSAIALALSLVLTAPVVLPQTAVVAEAATKTTIDFYRDTIGINGTTEIYLYNKQAKATYTYSSSKKSVATVSSKGVITGKAVGKAKITVKQKYKGKTTTVGSVTVNVKKSTLYEEVTDADYPWWFSAQPGFISKSDPAVIDAENVVCFMNPKAKYTFYSSTKDLVISKTGKVTEVKRAGKGYLTVKETYKGKTRTVGKMPIEMVDPKYTGEDTITLYVGDYGFMPAEYAKGLGRCNFSWSDTEQTEEEVLKEANIDDESAEDEVLLLNIDSEGNWDGYVSAKATGTRYCTLAQYNYLTKKYDKIIGRFKIVVPDTSKATDLRLPWDDPEYESYYFDKSTNTKTVDLWDEYDSIYAYVSPEHYSGGFEVTSSNPSVVSVSYEQYSYGELYISLGYLSAGTSTITVKANGVEKSFNVNVIGDDEDEEDEEDW